VRQGGDPGERDPAEPAGHHQLAGGARGARGGDGQHGPVCRLPHTEGQCLQGRCHQGEHDSRPRSSLSFFDVQWFQKCLAKDILMCAV